MSQPQSVQTIQGTSLKVNMIVNSYVPGTNCAKMCESESYLVLELLLIGQESGGCFRKQSQSPGMQSQSKTVNCFWHSEATTAPMTSFSIPRMEGAKWFFDVAMEILTVNYADRSKLKANSCICS